MNQSENHQKLVHEILRVHGARSDLRIWKNATGGAFNGDSFIKFGLKGSADIIGIKSPGGQFIAIEVKTGSAKQSQSQKNFERMIRNMGGIYALVRSIDDILF